MDIPFEDSTALSFLAEFHDEIETPERESIIGNLSDPGQMVAKAIVGDLERGPELNEQAYQAAHVLKQWAAHAAASR